MGRIGRGDNRTGAWPSLPGTGIGLEGVVVVVCCVMLIPPA
jgi:hypothetical protein